jgi:hypothetical protein
MPATSRATAISPMARSAGTALRRFGAGGGPAGAALRAAGAGAGRAGSARGGAAAGRGRTGGLAGGRALGPSSRRSARDRAALAAENRARAARSSPRAAARSIASSQAVRGRCLLSRAMPRFKISAASAGACCQASRRSGGGLVATA